jgi:hypothetical protein
MFEIVVVHHCVKILRNPHSREVNEPIPNSTRRKTDVELCVIFFCLLPSVRAARCVTSLLSSDNREVQL